MKVSILFLSILLSFNCFAGWKKKIELAEINTSEPYKVASSFAWVPNALNLLKAQEITSTTKMVVTNAVVTVGLYDWENDSDCEADDITKYKGKRLETYTFDYYYTADKDQLFFMWGASGPLVTCKNGNTISFSTKNKFGLRRNP